MKLNANQAQTAYEINRSTIGRWIKAEKLPVDSDGYFEESDFLVLFRKSKSWEEKRKKLSKEKSSLITANLPLDEPNQLTGEVKDNSDTGYTALEGFAKEGRNKVDLGNLKLMEDIREKRRKNAFGEGRLIERVLVKRFIGEMGEIDNTEWRSLPTRIMDDLMSICGISNPDIVIKLTARIDEEIFVILKSVQRSQIDFLNSLPLENENAR